jgi:multidrug efflux system membrane fusion protein
MHKLKVGRSVDGRTVIEDGLSPGQQVIVAGQYKVQPGTLVATAVASTETATPAKAR